MPETRLRTTLTQLGVLTVAQTIGGLRWVLGLAILHNLVNLLFDHPLATPVPWWTIIVGYLLLAGAPGRVLVLALGVRLLRIGIIARSPSPGWACAPAALGVRTPRGRVRHPVARGHPLGARYARAVGCRVGPNVDLRVTVPITGWATFGDDCAVEPGADLAGWWIDGGTAARRPDPRRRPRPHRRPQHPAAGRARRATTR